MRRLIDRTVDLLTVDALVNFICGKLGPCLRTAWSAGQRGAP
jgi:hypothetical protein